jgi:hypothetical protein
VATAAEDRLNIPRTAPRSPALAAAMSDRLEVNVTFDERGYIGSAPELRHL